MSDGGLIGGYTLHLERRNLSPRSIVMYRGILARADDWCGGLTTATRRQLEAWLDSLPLAPRARYTYISALHGFYVWALSEDLATADPTLKIARPKLPQTVPRPISSADLEQAIRLANRRMRLWLCLAAYQGLRCQEIAGVTVDDVLLGYDPPALIVAAGKGRKERVVPLHPETIMAFADFRLPRAGFAFCRQDRPGSKEPVKAHRVSELVAEYLHGLGINATAHQLRHWFGTSVYAVSLDLRLTQELMGHAHPSTTAGYVKFAQHQAAEVIGRLEARQRHPTAEGIARRDPDCSVVFGAGTARGRHGHSGDGGRTTAGS